MPLTITEEQRKQLQQLTWFWFPYDADTLYVNLDTIERELVYYELKPENIRILGIPVIDFFLLHLAVILTDNKSIAIRDDECILSTLRLLIVNDPSARSFEDAFSFRFFSKTIPLTHQQDVLNVLKGAYETRKKLLKSMQKWLYKHVLSSYDLLGICVSYYDWSVESKITLKLIRT